MAQATSKKPVPEKRRNSGSRKKEKLLDPGQPRVNVAETGGEFAGRHPAPDEPDIVRPGTGGQATGQTTRS